MKKPTHCWKCGSKYTNVCWMCEKCFVCAAPIRFKVKPRTKKG